jgi:type II secretory pathway pseudopilin PulG
MIRAAPHRAFTLLELLVAATITLLLAGAMVSVTAGMLVLWRRSQATYTQAATARQVFDLLEQDFQAAFHRPDSTHWLALDIIDSVSGLANHGWLLGQGPGKPAAGGSLRPWPTPDTAGRTRLADARFGLSGCWLRFVTANIEAGGTLPVVVAYQLSRRPVTGDPVTGNPAAVRYSLYRSAVSNADTLNSGYDVTATSYASPDNSPFSALSSAYRNARNVMNPSHANLLGCNVVDFGLWLYVRDPDGTLRKIYPSGPADISHQAIGGSMADDSRYPEIADVMIRVLTDEGAAQLEAIETNRGAMARPGAFSTDADWWWSVVEMNSEVFVRRIELKGRSP